MTWRRWGASRDNLGRAWSVGGGIDDGRRRSELWVVAVAHQGRACALREQRVLGVRRRRRRQTGSSTWRRQSRPAAARQHEGIKRGTNTTRMGNKMWEIALRRRAHPSSSSPAIPSPPSPPPSRAARSPPTSPPPSRAACSPPTSPPPSCAARPLPPSLLIVG
jgi:hypothetical protein